MALVVLQGMMRNDDDEGGGRSRIFVRRGCSTKEWRS